MKKFNKISFDLRSEFFYHANHPLNERIFVDLKGLECTKTPFFRWMDFASSFGALKEIYSKDIVAALLEPNPFLALIPKDDTK